MRLGRDDIVIRRDVFTVNIRVRDTNITKNRRGTTRRFLGRFLRRDGNSDDRGGTSFDDITRLRNVPIKVIM